MRNKEYKRESAGKKRKKNRKLINEGARRKRKRLKGRRKMKIEVVGWGWNRREKNEWVVGTEGVEGRGE